MKKLVLLFIISIFAFSVKAQEDFLIPIVGGNFSGMVFRGTDYDFEEHMMLKGGFIGGMKYQHQFDKPFLIEAGVLYNESGFILKDIDELRFYKNHPEIFQQPFDKIDFKFNYVSMPLMFGYRFGWFGSNFSIAPKVGIQFSYLASSKIKYVYNCVESNDEFDTKNKFDLAEVIEVEFSWNWSKRVNFFLDLAQRYSFTNLNSGDETILPEQLKMSNHQISLSLGLRIKLNSMPKSFFD